MDSNDPKNLDPKLREAYERVMTGQFQNPQQPQTPQPNPASSQPVSSSSEAPQEMPSAPKMETQTVEEPASSQNLTPPPNFTQDDVTRSPLLKGGETFINPAALSEVVDGDSPVKPAKNKSKLASIILIVGGFMFFAVYGIIWAKLFGLF